MKYTIAALVFLGLIAAVAASILVGLWRAGGATEPIAPPAPKEVDVVVANSALPASSIVDANAVKLVQVPEEDAPVSYFASREQVIGKVLIAPMVEGQPFTRESFARESSGLRLAAVLPEGMRAMSVTLNESSALEGMLYPGSHVDVLASFQAETPEDGRHSREMLSTVLLEDIQVLGVQDRTIVSDREETPERTGHRRRMVTLMVDSKQAEALQLAAAHGSISLALRNPLDSSEMAVRGTLFSDLSRVYADRLQPGVLQVGTSGLRALEVEVAPARDATPESSPARWTTVVTRGMTEQVLEFPIKDNSANDDSDGRGN